MEKTDNRAYRLLKKWMDAMLEYRVENIKKPRLHGSFLCPACGLIHGRCFDAVLPYCYLYKYEKDEKYLTAAKELMDYSSALKMDDGIYFNDFNVPWFGISAFYADALTETLETAGDALPEELKKRIESEILSIGEAVRIRFLKEGFYPAINYFVSAISLMAKLYKMTNEQKYLDAALHFKGIVLNRITEDNWLFGEGLDGKDKKTKKGFRAVDLGYNLDESYAFLIKAGRLLGDEELLELGIRLSKEALWFLLPDGAMDNSWGSRSAKWTYYGSRTSDGAGCLFALLKDIPEMREAAARQIEILEKCTDDEGLLSGGAWYNQAEEPSCTHHLFSHAKALVALAESGINLERETALPLDDFEGTRSYPSAGVHIASLGDTYASFKESDLDYLNNKWYNPLGGNLSLLYSRKLSSPILAATQNTGALIEPKNMQGLKNGEAVKCKTPRIDSEGFGSNLSSEFEAKFDAENYSFETVGRLSKTNGELGAEYKMEFEILSDGCSIKATCSENGKFILPLLLKPSETAGIGEENSLVLIRENGVVSVSSSGEIEVDLKGRDFNPCGGFTYIIPEITLQKNEEIVIEIRY